MRQKAKCRSNLVHSRSLLDLGNYPSRICPIFRVNVRLPQVLCPFPQIYRPLIYVRHPRTLPRVTYVTQGFCREISRARPGRVPSDPIKREPGMGSSAQVDGAPIRCWLELSLTRYYFGGADDMLGPDDK